MSEAPIIQHRESKSLDNFAKAMCKLQAKLGHAKKDAANPFFRSKYADLRAVFDALEPMHDHGFSIIQRPVGKCGLMTRVLHESGEWMESAMEMMPKEQNNPQAVGSCITYMRRYAIQSFLGIAAEEDDDGNAASGNSRSNTKTKGGKGGKEPF